MHNGAIETKFKFNSAICTSREQSDRLLALGLKKETADMWWQAVVADSKGKPIPKKDIVWFKSFHSTTQIVGLSRVEFIPAWSLHRLIEMALKYLLIYGISFTFGEDAYEKVIGVIELQIKEGCFNKEYLV